MIRTLPKGRGWMTKEIVLYQGCWLPLNWGLEGVLFVQNHFKVRPTDIFLAAFMKCGSTWVRTLIYSIAANLEALPLPRLFATHMPYGLFSKSVTSCGCKFVYIWRDPKDVLVSKWHFMNQIKSKNLPPLSLPEAFELFCEGVSEYGPFWDHVFGYWKASQESPHNILFLKYEDMQRESPQFTLRYWRSSWRFPFSPKEKGVVKKIVELCSFKNLSNLEVNKIGVERFTDEVVIENHNFFRKSQIGDFKNYLTGEMAAHLDSITMKKV
ncbi:sulfotransferase 2B [Actinidia rufa]|uniref:Sulfotransferase n=1 Tax=Actinidia rufa TaxID=165716 RepID=A0A7J0GN46_9ERIC|nr:sulfotransferase 2B [Actinidia rufa]